MVAVAPGGDDHAHPSVPGPGAPGRAGDLSGEGPAASPPVPWLETAVARTPDGGSTGRRGPTVGCPASVTASSGDRRDGAGGSPSWIDNGRAHRLGTRAVEGAGGDGDTSVTRPGGEGRPGDGESLDARLAALAGRPMGSGAPHVAPDPVNVPMIRHWAAAFEDANPVYTDPEAAAASRFGGIVAPPLMLQTWTMATPRITGIRERGGSPIETSESGPLAVFDEAGLTGTLATNSEFEIVRYLRPGETVSASTVIESVSEEKQTRLGPARFVTWVTTYTDGAGEVVGRQSFRILKFDPRAAPS